MVLQSIEIRSETLNNGLRFSADESENSTGSVALVGSIRAGANRDEPDKFGTAELVSRLLTRGTKSDPSSASIARKIEEIGATLQFSNNDERVKFSAKCHSSVLPDLLKIISDCLLNPLFPSDQIELSKAEIISDLDQEEDDTRSQAHQTLMSMIYGGDKIYGRNSMGKKENIKNLTREDLASFYDQFYSPKSTIIAATGNFEYSDLLSRIDSFFGKWNPASSNNVNEKVSMTGSPDSFSKTANGELKVIPMNHKSQADVDIAVQAVPRKSKDYYPIMLGNLLLGQIGLYGRLGQNVRERKGVAYYCFSSTVAKTFGGHLAFYAGVNPANASKAIEGMSEEIGRIQTEEISEDELSIGKSNILGSLSISLDTSSERVNIIHEIEYHSLGGSKYFEIYEKEIDSVTSMQVLSLFAKYAAPQKLSMTVAGPIKDGTQFRLPGEFLVAAK